MEKWPERGKGKGEKGEGGVGEKALMRKGWGTGQEWGKINKDDNTVNRFVFYTV